MFAEKVLPTAVVDKKRKGERVIIGNAGSVRFDLVRSVNVSYTARLTFSSKGASTATTS